jgi:hypothetical protein
LHTRLLFKAIEAAVEKDHVIVELRERLESIEGFLVQIGGEYTRMEGHDNHCLP